MHPVWVSIADPLSMQVDHRPHSVGPIVRANQQIRNLNDLLGFADDTLVFGQNIHMVRKAIDGISIEIA